MNLVGGEVEVEAGIQELISDSLQSFSGEGIAEPELAAGDPVEAERNVALGLVWAIVDGDDAAAGGVFPTVGKHLLVGRVPFPRRSGVQQLPVAVAQGRLA